MHPAKKNQHRITIYFNPSKPGPHLYGPYRFEHLPVFVEIRGDDHDRDQVILMTEIENLIGYRPIRETMFESLTLELATQARDRIVYAIGATGNQTGPLLSELYSDDNSTLPFPYCRRGKKNSPKHREKISQALKGKKYPESRNQKISETMTGRPQPHKVGNINRAKSYVLISPSGAREMVHNLKNACSQRNLNPSNMTQVSRAVRRHHKQWGCLNADIFDWK
jgi:hypothetical protein